MPIIGGGGLVKVAEKAKAQPAIIKKIGQSPEEQMRKSIAYKLNVRETNPAGTVLLELRRGGNVFARPGETDKLEYNWQPDLQLKPVRFGAAFRDVDFANFGNGLVFVRDRESFAGFLQKSKTTFPIYEPHETKSYFGPVEFFPEEIGRVKMLGPPLALRSTPKSFFEAIRKFNEEIKSTGRVTRETANNFRIALGQEPLAPSLDDVSGGLLPPGDSGVVMRAVDDRPG